MGANTVEDRFVISDLLHSLAGNTDGIDSVEQQLTEVGMSLHELANHLIQEMGASYNYSPEMTELRRTIKHGDVAGLLQALAEALQAPAKYTRLYNDLREDAAAARQRPKYDLVHGWVRKTLEEAAYPKTYASFQDYRNLSRAIRTAHAYMNHQ